jgi:uncharacterized membrane protein
MEKDTCILKLSAKICILLIDGIIQQIITDFSTQCQKTLPNSRKYKSVENYKYKINLDLGSMSNVEWFGKNRQGVVFL